MNLRPLKNYVSLFLALLAFGPIANATDYYWVGGSGDWSEISHWVTTSGGTTTHTVPPTLADNVFFDGSSFSSAADIVTVQADASFRDLRIQTGLEATFTGPESVTLNCNGLILISGDIQYNFNGTLRMVGNGSAQTVSALGITLARHVVFDNPDGLWIAGPFIVDSLLQFVSGNLIVVDDIETKFVEFKAASPSRLTLQQEIILSGSDFVLNGVMIPVALIDLTNINYALASKGFMQFYGLESTIKVIPAGQTMSLDGIEFLNKEGTANIDVIGFGSFKTSFTRIVPDGFFKGNFDTDILELGSAETYTWESGEIFDIGTISAVGVSCVQLTIFRSSVPGEEAFLDLEDGVSINGGELIGVKDVHVLDGTIALENSFDQGNIDGWIIAKKELFEEEQVPLCPGQSIYLRPDEPEEEWSYDWSDNSTLDSLNIVDPNIYALEVTDAEGCINSDTIEVFLFDPGTFSIGNDTTICEGSMIEVSADVTAESYTWSNGSTEASTFLSEGQHFVEILLNSCEVIDTIIISFKALPEVDLGADQMNCLGEDLNLSLNLSGVDIVWSDGSTESDFSTEDSGTYWVDVNLDGCVERDSIEFSYVELPSVSLGRDTTICDGDAIVYNFDAPSLSFEWNDNVMLGNRSIGTPGEYWVEVNDGQCVFRDSVLIGISPRPVFDLGRDTMLCTGDAITLTAAPEMDESIVWIDGSDDLLFEVMNSGSYWLDVNKQGCVIRDEVIITFNDPPTFDLGKDTLICEQVPLILRPGISDATYQWQDGSNEERYLIDKPGIYTVVVSKNGCTTMDEIDVETKVCTFYRAYLPEVFSPNADGINDEYKPEFSPDIQIVKYELLIYDRWGSQLFKSEDPLIGWDGTFYQKPLNSGTFVYTIAIDYIDDRGAGSKLQRGEFVILK